MKIKQSNEARSCPMCGGTGQISKPYHTVAFYGDGDYARLDMVSSVISGMMHLKRSAQVVPRIVALGSSNVADKVVEECRIHEIYCERLASPPEDAVFVHAFLPSEFFESIRFQIYRDSERLFIWGPDGSLLDFPGKHRPAPQPR